MNPNQNFQINFVEVIYMISEIQYGGRITDNLDRELFNVYGEGYFRETIFTDEFNLGKVAREIDGKESVFYYKIPKYVDWKDYVEFILGNFVFESVC